jgi:hypothetical protein
LLLDENPWLQGYQPLQNAGVVAHRCAAAAARPIFFAVPCLKRLAGLLGKVEETSDGPRRGGARPWPMAGIA